MVNATSCSVARTWTCPPVVSKLNAEARPASRASVLQHREPDERPLVRSLPRGPADCRVTESRQEPWHSYPRAHNVLAEHIRVLRQPPDPDASEPSRALP